MSFCINCGSEISDDAVFCSSCGSKINKTADENKVTVRRNFDFKGVLNTIKEYFLHFYLDYNSKLFKFAMIIFLSIGLGESIYPLIIDILHFDIYVLFPDAYTVFSLLFKLVLFGIFSIAILRIKSKSTIKKSNFLLIFWNVSLVLYVLVSLTGFNLFEYVFFSQYVSYTVGILFVTSTALLLFNNKPQSPIVLIASTLAFVLRRGNLDIAKLCISIYKLGVIDKKQYLMDALYEIRFIILAAVLFLLVYIIPKKVSKWLTCISALSAIIFSLVKLISNFSLGSIVNCIIEIGVVVSILLFALSCSKKKIYDCVIQNKESTQKRVVKVGVISASLLIFIVFSSLLASAVVCAAQVNSGLARWKDEIICGDLNTESQWDEMNEDVFKYLPTKFIKHFVDDYSIYETLKENKTSMERIAICYSAYKSGNVDDDILEEYSYINIDDSWEYDSTLSSYYNKYIDMQPRIENVFVRAYVDVDNGEIKVTVENDNPMPISKCTVKCNFTILFIEPGYYSNNEYGRGVQTIVVENINGSSEKEEIISFNPDDYYNGYGSYIMAALFDSDVTIESIE